MDYGANFPNLAADSMAVSSVLSVVLCDAKITVLFHKIEDLE